MRDFVALLKQRAFGNFREDELTQIFDQFSPSIYKYVLRLCRDQIMADNIVGDVFAQLLEQVATGKDLPTNLRSYLYKTAYQLVVDHSADNPRNTPLEVAMASFKAERFVPTQSGIEERAVMEALISVMNTELTGEQRHVIMLRLLEDFTLKETAEIMGKDVNNIRVIQKSATVKLRKAAGLEIEDNLEHWLDAASSTLPGTQTTDAPPPEGKKKKKGK